MAFVITPSCNNKNESKNDSSTKNTEKSVSTGQDIEAEPTEVCVLEGNGFIVSLNKNGEVISRRDNKTTTYIDGKIQKGEDIFWENQDLGRFKVILSDGTTHTFDEGNTHEIVEEKKIEKPHKETRQEHNEKQGRLMKDPTLTADYNVLYTLEREDLVVVLTKDHRLWYYVKATGHRAVFYSTNIVESIEWQNFEEGKVLCHINDGTENVVDVGTLPITGTKHNPYHKDPENPSWVIIDGKGVNVRICPSDDKECLLRNSDGSVVKLDKGTILPYISEVKGPSREKSYYIVEYDGGQYYINQYFAYAEE